MGLPSKWRSPASAEDFANHDFADFAQEFLRRNPDYQAEYSQVDQSPSKSDEPNRRDAIANKWGLSFRLRSQHRSPQRTGSVAPGYDARYSHPWTRPGTLTRTSPLRRPPSPHFLWLAAA